MSEELVENKGMNTFQRFIGMITSPRATFEDIIKNPKLAMPMIVTSVINAIISIPLALRTMQITMDAVEKSGTIPSEVFAQTKAISMISGLVGGIIGGLAAPLFAALMISALCKLFMVFTGDEGTFKNLYIISLYAYVPVLIGAFIKAMLLLSTKPTSIYGIQTSLAMLAKAPAGFDKPSPLFALLSGFDLFNIWYFILITIGVAVLLKISYKKSAIMAFSIFALGLLASIGMAAFSSLLPTANVPKG